MFVSLNRWPKYIWQSRTLTLVCWWFIFIFMILNFIVMSLLFVGYLVSLIHYDGSISASTWIISGYLESYLLIIVLFQFNENTIHILVTKSPEFKALHQSLITLNKRFIFFKKISKNIKQTIGEENDSFFGWSYDTYKIANPCEFNQIKMLNINQLFYVFYLVFLPVQITMMVQINSQLVLWIMVACVYAIAFLIYYIWMTVFANKIYRLGYINKRTWKFALFPLVNLLCLHWIIAKENEDPTSPNLDIQINTQNNSY